MESSAVYATYPVMMAFLLGVAFLHVGLRSRSSLTALVSLVLLLAWAYLAHWAVHRYFIAPDDITFERVGQYSAHPVLDVVNVAVTTVLMLVFVAAFLLSALQVSVRLPKVSVPPSATPGGDRPATMVLWMAAAASTVIALAAFGVFRHLAAIGPEDVRSTLAAAIALMGAFCGLLLSAIAIRRRLLQTGTYP